MVLTPCHQGPNLKRSSARQDRFPAAEMDIVRRDVFQRLAFGGQASWLRSRL